MYNCISAIAKDLSRVRVVYCYEHQMDFLENVEEVWSLPNKNINQTE